MSWWKQSSQDTKKQRSFISLLVISKCIQRRINPNKPSLAEKLESFAKNIEETADSLKGLANESRVHTNLKQLADAANNLDEVSNKYSVSDLAELAALKNN